MVKTHEPQFLWQPTRQELLTTRFMRNRLLFTTLAKTLLPTLRTKKQAPLTILFWACSIGCEPYTLRFLLDPDCEDEIIGVDVDSVAIDQARRAVYQLESTTSFEHESLLTQAEFAALFEPAEDIAPGTLRIAAPYTRKVSFHVGDLFFSNPSVPLNHYDVVFCNNFLLHLRPRSADIAWTCLYEYVINNGVLVVGGCNPNVRSAAAKRLGLRPYLSNLMEISMGWSGVSGAWCRTPRPAWAYPEPTADDPDYPYLAGEIFFKSQ
jgi:chemotaxis methyl-accepting protein methylase